MLLKEDLYFQSFLTAKQFKMNNSPKISFGINVVLIFSHQIMLLLSALDLSQFRLTAKLLESRPISDLRYKTNKT